MCGRYVTAEDVGVNVADMVSISNETKFVAGLPVAEGAVGGDPGPHTSYGVYLGVRAAVKRALGKDSLAGLHIALQGAGSVAGGFARRAAADGARLSIADIDQGRAQALAAETGGTVVGTDEIMTLEADVLSPNALGAILDEAVDRGAQRAGRRRRRQQPARDQPRTATASTPAPSSTRPIT